jgi:hypothetical protein
MDLALGIFGVVRAANRDAGTGVVLYRVELTDGRVVFRHAEELAQDLTSPGGSR